VGHETSTVILRAATPADVAALLDVQQEGAIHGLGHVFPQEQHPFPRETIAVRWKAEIATPGIDVYLYTEDHGTIRGFAATQDNEILHFGTALSTWGSGLASQFHDALLEAMIDNLSTTTLRLRVFEENHRARRFYEKHGWRPTGISSRTTFPPHPRLLEYERAASRSSR